MPIIKIIDTYSADGKYQCYPTTLECFALEYAIFLFSRPVN